MGISTGPRKKTLSEINVTPLVDVMLVLLVIFMITAPMLEQGMDLDLPEVRAGAVEQSDERLTVSVRKDGGVFVDGTQLPDDRLEEALAAILENRSDEPVYLEADRSVVYGRVAQVLATVRRAGAGKLHLVTEEPETAR